MLESIKYEMSIKLPVVKVNANELVFFCNNDDHILRTNN